jgi:hypothetical protein
MMLVAARRNSAVPSHSEKRPQDCVPLSNGPPRMVPEWGPRVFSVLLQIANTPISGGKVPASVMAQHPTSLFRTVNDSLQTRISDSRMTQSGRSVTDCSL